MPEKVGNRRQRQELREMNNVEEEEKTIPLGTSHDACLLLWQWGQGSSITCQIKQSTSLIFFFFFLGESVQAKVWVRGGRRGAE